MKKTGIMTDSHSGILNEEAERLGIKVLTLIFVWKACRLIQIDFFLQNLILCSKTYHLYQFRSNDQYQSQNINQYDFFQMIQSGRFFL